MRVFLTLLLTSLLCTCGRAQLVLRPAALTFLADQLSEMALNGDLGPTRTAATNSYLHWQPSKIGNTWVHSNVGMLAAGHFTSLSSGLSAKGYDDYQFAAGLGAHQHALAASIQPDLPANPRLHLRYLSDRVETGRPKRENLVGQLYSNWNGYDYQGGVSVLALTEQTERDTRFSTDNQRYQIFTNHSFELYETALYFKLLSRLENTARRFEESTHRGERRLGEFLVGIKSNHYNQAIRWSVEGKVEQTEDDYQSPNIQLKRREQTAALTGRLTYDVYPFRLRFEQQYRTSRLDPDRYLPSLGLSWYTAYDQVVITALLNRGGIFRHPLLSERELAYTRRSITAEPLVTEDFWRYGLKVKGKFSQQTSFSIQAVERKYARYTAVLYPADGRIQIAAIGGVQRATLAGEIQQMVGEKLQLTANYRYDNSRFPNDAAVLHPARHATWLRVRWDDRLGHQDWYLTLKSGYLWVSGVTALGIENSKRESRDRLDASVRLRFKSYWFALRGEQLLRRETFSAYGSDPFSASDNIPLGNEFATLSGRYVSIAVGGGF